MSALLDAPPFGPRDDARLLAEMNRLTGFHLEHCPPYRAVLGDWSEAATLEALPATHVGLYKRVDLTSREPESGSRVLESSATTSGTPSRIALDADSSALQSQSTERILGDFIGDDPRPLLVLDSARSLRSRGAVSARIAAAMSLKPFASDIRFLIKGPVDERHLEVDWDAVAASASGADSMIVYGFTWILWRAWGETPPPEEIRRALGGVRIDFVHSGGWKKLDDEQVDRQTFDEALVATAGDGSRVTDYYGLVEQVGIVYPLCSAGYRHPPRWADVLVRDPFSGDAVEGRVGQLQLMNVLALGGPYHNVLTEDLAVVDPGPCPCGRSGRRFRLEGRIPKAELRGCANV